MPLLGKTFAQLGGLITASFQPSGTQAVAINKTRNQYIAASGTGGMVFDSATNQPLAAIRPQLLQANGLAAPVGFKFMSVNEAANKMYTTDNAMRA
jgi:hypothetical protein